MIFGSASWDRVSIHADLDHIPDEKCEPTDQYEHAGGGGVNTAISLREFAADYGMDVEIVLVTKIGPEDYPGKDQLSFSNEARRSVLDQLHGIKVIDLVSQQPYRTPVNTITSWQKGRFISRDKKALDIQKAFADVALPCDPGKEEKAVKEILDADMVFIQGNYGPIVNTAAEVARNNKVSVTIDYDVTKPEKTSAAAPALKDSTYILAPGEALAPGMSTPSRDTLFDTIVYDDAYKACLTAVSDAANPVRVNYDYTNSMINIPFAGTAVDSLAAGDVKSAGFIIEILKGTHPVESIRQACRLASFSTLFVGRTWTEKVGTYINSIEFRNPDPRPLQAVVPELMAA